MVFGLVGGLGLFLYGMNLMGDGLRRAAGDKMKEVLAALTSTPLRGVLMGVAVTAVIQSSSATTVMLVSFVNAGLMTLRQAIGVIMGANIGTTVTAQLIAFNLSDYALPAIGLGFIVFMMARRRGPKSVGQIILGFGLLFLGLSVMTSAVAPLRESPVFIHAMQTFGRTPILGVLLGLGMTLIIQSSSATVGMLMAVALASPDVVTIHVAIPILLGDNIGTCITAILAAAGANRTAKRTAVVHFLFNFFGTVIFMVLLKPYTWLVVAVTRTGGIQRQIANAHTLFNLLNTLIWLPGAGLLERLATRVVPGEDLTEEAGAKYLDKHVLVTPGVALGLVTDEVARIGHMTQTMLNYSRRALVESFSPALEKELESREEIVDDVSRQIVLYLSHMVARASLTDSQSHRLTGLMHASGDVERMADGAEQLMRYARDRYDSKIPFSDVALEELNGIFDLAEEIVTQGITALADEDARAAERVYAIHPTLDEGTEALRVNHIGRLNDGKCTPPAGVIFVEIMNTLERVGDLAVNLADSVMNKKSPRLEGK